MFNFERTKEVFGYELSLERVRRTNSDVASTGGTKPKDLLVIDNCPSCYIERTIKLNQSRKNKPCSKCFHSTPAMVEAKRNQNKEKSEETKQKMKESHWSKYGGVSAFKGKNHTQTAKELLRNATIKQFDEMTEEEKSLHRIKASVLQRGLSVEEFDGFVTPLNTAIRQSVEGKAWIYDVLAKSNFTCDLCAVRGGKLHAHHINGFNLFPDQRFAVENGACLCESCHKLFHSKYGNGNNTKEQYQEFKMIYLDCNTL